MKKEIANSLLEGNPGWVGHFHEKTIATGVEQQQNAEGFPPVFLHHDQLLRRTIVL
jgi:hypothetical protein